MRQHAIQTWYLCYWYLDFLSFKLILFLFFHFYLIVRNMLMQLLFIDVKYISIYIIVLRKTRFKWCAKSMVCSMKNRKFLIRLIKNIHLNDMNILITRFRKSFKSIFQIWFYISIRNVLMQLYFYFLLLKWVWFMWITWFKSVEKS